MQGEGGGVHGGGRGHQRLELLGLHRLGWNLQTDRQRKQVEPGLFTHTHMTMHTHARIHAHIHNHAHTQTHKHASNTHVNTQDPIKYATHELPYSSGCDTTGPSRTQQDFLARGGQGELDSMYVFLNMYMYSLLCFPLGLLLSFIWQWFSKCKK